MLFILPPAPETGVEVRLLAALAKLKTVLGGSAAAGVLFSEVAGLEWVSEANLLTTGIFRIVASFIGVHNRFVGGGVGLGGFEKVAIPIGFDDSVIFLVFKEDLSPNEAFRTEVDGELLLEVEALSLEAEALETEAP